MKKLIPFLLLLVALTAALPMDAARKRFVPPTAAAPVAVDMYISGDGATGLVTTVTMAACTFSTDAGAWALPDNAGTTAISHNSNGNLGALRRSVTVNGGTYTGVITNGLQLSPVSLTTDRARRTITAKGTLLIGFLFRANVGAADFNVLDFLNLEASGGANWSVSQWKNYSPTIFRVHSAAGTTDMATSVDNQIYWIQLRYDNPNNLAEMAAWTVSGSTYTFVDSKTIAMTTAADCVRIFVGLEAHGVASSDVYNWCNLIVQWTAPGAVSTLMLP